MTPQFFHTPSYRRTATFWVLSAKKGETRERRLAQLILDSSHGQRLEMLRHPASRNEESKSTPWSRGASIMAAVLLALSASASPHNPDTDWFHDAGWGVFVHYLWDVQNVGGRENAQGKPPTTWDALVREFDAERVAEQVQETGAPYVFFTMMQRTRYLI